MKFRTFIITSTSRLTEVHRLVGGFTMNQMFTVFDSFQYTLAARSHRILY